MLFCIFPLLSFCLKENDDSTFCFFSKSKCPDNIKPENIFCPSNISQINFVQRKKMKLILVDDFVDEENNPIFINFPKCFRKIQVSGIGSPKVFSINNSKTNNFISMKFKNIVNIGNSNYNTNNNHMSDNSVKNYNDDSSLKDNDDELSNDHVFHVLIFAGCIAVVQIIIIVVSLLCVKKRDDTQSLIQSEATSNFVQYVDT